MTLFIHTNEFTVETINEKLERKLLSYLETIFDLVLPEIILNTLNTPVIFHHLTSILINKTVYYMTTIDLIGPLLHNVLPYCMGAGGYCTVWVVMEISDGK